MKLGMACFREGVASAFLLSMLSSCSAAIDVPRSEVPRLAELGRSGSVSVDNGGREVRIEREMMPNLTIKRTTGCSFFDLYVDGFRTLGAESQCLPKTTFPLEA